MAIVKRCFISLGLAFVLATVGLVLVPSLGRIAQPFLCAGTLEPETRLRGMQFRCVAAADGRITSVPTDYVIRYTLPLLTFVLLLPVSTLLAERERRARIARGTMRDDLASAVTARAEILRVVHQSAFGRPALLHAAELTLILWVQPPNGRPYEARVAWLVDDESLSRLMVGSVIQVRVNPRRPEHVYPDQPWAHYAWWQ
jgi:hypothetical protein